MTGRRARTPALGAAIGARARGLLRRGHRHLRRGRTWLLRALLDALDRIAGRRDPMVPPRRHGMASQLRIGDRLVERALIDAAGLGRDERVLDIGCGIGRAAVPLTRYLDRGSYEGFDVVPESIEWCRRQIAGRDPRFRFQLVDLRNLSYNPAGGQSVAAFRFPYEGASFDLVFAFSVFTHLRPFETARYLEETARVLRPGGRISASFFLITPESERIVAAGAADATPLGGRVGLEHELTDERGHRYRASDPTVPERKLALYEDDARKLHERAGLEIVEIRPGHWGGREPRPGRIGQDLIVARRT